MEEQRDERLEKRRAAAQEFVLGTFEELVEKSASENPEVRALAASRLMTCDDPRGIPLLMRLMSDESAKVRSGAAIGLSHYEAEEGRDILISHLKSDTSGHVRAMCAFALRNIGGACAELLEALEDDDWHVRLTAIPGLDDCDNETAIPAMERVLDDEEWSVQYFASLELMDRGFSNSKVVEVLSALKDIPEAVEHVKNTQELDLMLGISEKLECDVWELPEKSSQEETLEALRKEHGEEVVPHLSSDPIGDLIARAQALLDRK